MVKLASLLIAAASALAAALAAAATSGVTAPTVDVDALVSYETRQVMSSGVTRVDTWQERLVRRGSQVWTERLLPPASHLDHERESVAEHMGHKHFNADTSARWLSLGPNGKVEVRFVDREHKTVVSVPSAEFGTVGFDGRFDGAASIVPPSVALSMKPTSGTSPQGRWLADRSDGWSHRVLWSDAKQLAMKVESQRDDGSIRRVVSLRLLPASSSRSTNAAPPWQAVGGFTQKNYDDFMD